MGFFSDLIKHQKNTMPILYLGGHPEITGPRTYRLESTEDSVVFHFGMKPMYEIKKEDIVHVGLERSSHRSAGKAAAGAIIGGVLTGGIGAIAGAAIGGRKKDDSVIYVTCKYGVAEVELMFKGPNKKDDINRVYNDFVKLLKIN